MISSLEEIPAIAAYLKRIGAEAVNFRRADIIREVAGYPKAVGKVYFKGGTVTATGEADPPRAEEIEAIEEALKSAEFPKPMALIAIPEAPPGVNMADPNVFTCHNLRGEVVMIHERYQMKDGGKGFVPWTRWSDGQWRKMEPEVMPFYGIPGHQNKTTLFIHEGAKAAKRIQRMISGEIPADDFPWFEQMRWGHHIGWIGGIWALDRSDWEGLAKMGWRQVIIVSDNDSGGRRVVPPIAEHFDCPVFTIQFDTQWPANFDLGDDWPEDLFGDEGQYIGPPYEQCVQPATWATREWEEVGARGGVTTHAAIREVFVEQWVWIQEQDIMINLEMPHYKMAAGKFNGFIRPFSHVPNTLGYFQQQYTGNQMRLTYDPSRDGIIVRDSDGLQSINQYQGPNIAAASGSWEPWDEFCNYMFPHAEDRHEVRRWIATLRARPDIRIIYGLLMMSERQGTGKGTISRIIADLIGRHNASFPSEGLITGSDFNGWASSKRLIVVDEIYAGHSWKAYNKLKPYVTDDNIEINVKFQATWTMPNWTHYVLMSNSRIALKLEEGDRRWLVPEVIEVPWAVEKFREFNRWLRRGGMSHIAHWCETFEDRGEGKYIMPGEIAPTSASKRRLITESRSDAEVALINIAEEMKENKEPVAVPFTGMKRWLADRFRDNVYETPQQMARILAREGVWITDRVKINKGKAQLIVNREEMLGWEVQKLRDALVMADELIPPEL